MYHTGVSFESSKSFRRGIHMLRDVVRAGRERDRLQGRSGFPPELREPVQVRLNAPYTPEAHVLVRLNTANLYVSSVHSTQAGFYFRVDNAPPLIKTQEDQVILGFSGHYNDLGRFVSLGRLTPGSIDGAIASIGAWERTTEISNVRKTATGKDVQSDQARQLLAICLLVAESTRFFPVAEYVERCLDGNASEGLSLGEIDSLVRKWEQQSRDPDSTTVAVPAEVQTL
jgi:hypothetical protein